MRSMRWTVCGLVFLGLLVPLGPGLAQERPVAGPPTIIFVDQGAGGANNGSSWADAYTDLNTALLGAVSGSEIWVAEGTYRPGTLRSDTFQLKNGVGLYGGFPPGGGGDTFDARDPIAYPAVLNGDVGTPGVSSDNSYHVVTGNGTDTTAVLDGFTVTGGHADVFPDVYGAGMLNDTGSPTVQNTIFVANAAADYGGGMENAKGSPRLRNVAFLGNTAGLGGGGMDNFNGSSPELVNVLFAANAADEGGGIKNDLDSSPLLTNVSFVGNEATMAGGAFMDTQGSQPHLVNSILWANTPDQASDCATCNAQILYSMVQGGCPTNANCGNLISGKPLFVREPGPGDDGVWGTDDDDYGDLRLTAGSNALDAGDDTAVVGTVFVDLVGNPRRIDRPDAPNISGGAVDLGAYEAPPARLYVDLDVPSPGTGTSWTDAFWNLQEALHWARSGPTDVWVAQGTYTPGDIRYATFRLLTGLGLYGGFPTGGGDGTLGARDWETYPTLLSGDIGVPLDDTDNSYHVVTASEVDGSALVDGVTITGGKADGSHPHNHGGGLHVMDGNPALKNLVVQGNRAAQAGGGLYLLRSGTRLDSVRFVDNHAIMGGGMMSDESEPYLKEVEFEDNEVSNYGGGFASQDGTQTLIDVTFEHNQGVLGGGARILGGVALMANVDLTRNQANDGGGLHSSGCTLLVSNLVARGNTAGGRGGGIYAYDTNAVLSTATFASNTAASTGGAIYVGGASTAGLSNDILWGNSAPGGAQIYHDGTKTVALSYSVLQGGCAGAPGVSCATVPMTGDPKFVRDPDPGAGGWGDGDDDPGDLRLLPSSPAIDAGKNASVSKDLLDLDGDKNKDEPIPYDIKWDPRFMDVPTVADSGSGTPPVADMGAYETRIRTYLPLVVREW